MKSGILHIIIFVVLVAVLVIPRQMFGQSFNATINGMVTDPSGAVVPGAKLTLRALGTNAVATTTSGCRWV